jgi:hypothetical protein
VSGLRCCRSARRRGAHRRCTARPRLARLIVARTGLGRLGEARSTPAADVAAGRLRPLLRRSRGVSRRRRVSRHRRSGRASGRTGKLPRRGAMRLRCCALCRHAGRGDVRGSPWRGHVRCGRHVRRRRRMRRGSRASCRGCASGRRSSSLVRLRGCGCRNRGRSDKECRDADVPLEHDTELLRRPLGVNAGVACGFRLRRCRGLHAAYMACDQFDDQMFRIARLKNSRA